MTDRIKNADIQRHLLDATQEAASINSATVWIPTGNATWQITDDKNNHLGNVNALICVKSGVCEFKYRYDHRTYHNIDPVKPVQIDAPNWSDREELAKLIAFDQAIVDAHGL